MTKNEIKAALDFAGISYAKKANLETLQALYDTNVAPVAQHIEDFNSAQSVVAEDHSIKPGAPLTEEEAAAELPSAESTEIQTTEEVALDAFLTMDADAVHDANCPHCGIHLSNGLLCVDDHAANSDQTYRQQRDPNFQKGYWTCMGCGGHFGAKVEYVPIQEGLKIEKDRPEQNGIKRPSIGGKCRAIWDALDVYREETGELPTSKVVKELAADEGWNPNNASIEFYQWRKYHGIPKG